MIRAISSVYKFVLLSHPYRTTLAASMSGLKVKSGKKPTSTVLAALSSEYMGKNNHEQNKTKSGKDGNKARSREEQAELMEIHNLKNSWLGNALEDDLLVQTKQWQGDSQIQAYINNQKNSHTNFSQKQNSQKQHQSPQKQSPKPSAQQSPKRLFNSQTLTHQSSHTLTQQQQQQAWLKVKYFKKDLSKIQHIKNSRKFIQIICNIFPRHQVQRILAQIKQFCSKRDLNMPSLMTLNLQSDKSSPQVKKTYQRKLQKQIKIIEKITKDREKKVFLGVRRIFDQSLTDVELVENLLSLLAQSDPYIMNSQDIHKLVYNHDQGTFEDQAIHHKSGINLVLDKKQQQSILTQKNQDKSIDQLIGAKKDFIKESQTTLNKPISKKQKFGNQGHEEIDAFEEFSLGEIDKENKNNKNQNQGNNKQFLDTIRQQQKPSNQQKHQQKQDKKRQKSMKLIVKKNLNPQQKVIIPQHFQINQKSLHQIQRILFKNKKIIEDNVIFKKVKSKTLNPRMEKQRQDFGLNWVYAYEMPYALEHESSQEFVDYLSKNYGDIIEYFIFPYKNMLQKKQDIMIHIDALKKMRIEIYALEAIKNGLTDPRTKKPQAADKLLQKIEKEKSLKLNKSSMVFKFRRHQQKQQFMLPQMRLYGINFQNFRNIRFEEAQSKKIVAISMIPWGCSSDDIQKVINKALKPIDVEVSYQSCILAKGFIFIELDNFYECLKACQLLNNLQFQGHSLKVQINYGSSKIYGEKFKNALELDHYEMLVKKLKDIKCFYNEIYQD